MTVLKQGDMTDRASDDRRLESALPEPARWAGTRSRPPSGRPPRPRGLPPVARCDHPASRRTLEPTATQQEAAPRTAVADGEAAGTPMADALEPWTEPFAAPTKMGDSPTLIPNSAKRKSNATSLDLDLSTHPSCTEDVQHGTPGSPARKTGTVSGSLHS